MTTSDVTDAQVVDACRRSHEGGVREAAGEILVRETGAPLKVVMRAMGRAYRGDLVEYGVSLRAAWPAPVDEPLPVEVPRLTFSQLLGRLRGTP